MATSFLRRAFSSSLAASLRRKSASPFPALQYSSSFPVLRWATRSSPSLFSAWRTAVSANLTAAAILGSDRHLPSPRREAVRNAHHRRRTNSPPLLGRRREWCREPLLTRMARRYPTAIGFCRVATLLGCSRPQATRIAAVPVPAPLGAPHWPKCQPQSASISTGGPLICAFFPSVPHPRKARAGSACLARPPGGRHAPTGAGEMTGRGLSSPQNRHNCSPQYR